MPEPFVVGGSSFAPGSRGTVHLPLARRATAAEVALPVHVVCGRKAGPRLFVCAAIHGDELNGVEVVRRLLAMPLLKRLRGTLLAVPVVNVYGFVAQSRYLPDRRDLNRSFPGSKRGSLAARLAHLFMTEVVARSTHGIDLHTGALHRSNLPQVRACLDDPETERLARVFGTPVVLDSSVRDSSLREAVRERQIPMLVYEAGEALRFDELAIRAGVRGVVSVMRALGMLPERRTSRRVPEPFVARGSTWVRAPESGIVVSRVELGSRVAKGQVLGVVSDPVGEEPVPIPSPVEGVLIGRSNLPLAHEGDALFHVAVFEHLEPVVEELEAFREALEPSGS